MSDALLQIAKEVAEPAGLQLSAMPPSAIQQALNRRQHRTGIRTPARYREHLEKNTEEQQHLLEELLVHESFFFRDARAFAEMRRWCLEWLRTHKGTLRILSAPCSTGEEPYSISAMLWMAGVQRERYLVDAVDISTPALAYAEAGVYGSFSLRGLSTASARKFLEETAQGWHVRREVSERVRFWRLNLVEAGNEGARAVAGEGPYDLICSRNLLLYQTPAAKARLVRRLRSALAPGGRLVIGAADWCTELAAAFELAGPAEAFAMKARTADKGASEPIAPVVKASTKTVAGRQDREQEVPVPPLSRPITAEDAHKLAEHSAHAEQVEMLHGNSQRAWDSGQWEQAERLCRQALYLDGSHLPSLQLLRTIWAPRMPDRLQRALDVRIERHARGNVLDGGRS